MTRKLALALGLCAIAAWAESTLPLKNGGFEDGMAGWETDSHGMTLFLEDAACTGQMGIRITDTSQQKGSELASEKMPAKAGALYGISLMTRERANAQGTCVYIVFHDKTGNPLTTPQQAGERLRRLTPGNDWHPFRMAARAVPGTATVSVRIHSLTTTTSDVDVDDIRLTEYTAAEACLPALKAITVEKKMTNSNEDLKLQLDYSRIEDAMVALEASVHPRLYASDQLFQDLRHDALENDGIRSRLFSRMCEAADWMLTQPVQQRTLTGRRLLPVSQLARHRITLLALCYKISGKDAWRERCIDELRAVCAFSDWNPTHFLDVAEMTMGVAIGYDWLYNELSDDDRACFAQALWQKGLCSSPATAEWRTDKNNWGQVCNAGILAGALAMAELHPEFCRKQVYDSIRNLAIPMSAYAPIGNYPEAPAYWSFGTGRNICALMMLQQAFGTDFGLSELPGFKETAYYNELLTGPSGVYFSYADGAPMKRHSLWQLWWFANRFDLQPLIERTERNELEKALAKPQLNMGDPGDFEFHPLLFFLVFDPEESQEPQEQLPLTWNPQGPIPIAIMRSSWEDPNAVFIGLKGGTASGPHPHQDGGSFVLDAHGIRWFADLGPEGYTRIEAMGLDLWNRNPDSDRWKLFRYGTRGHNTILINGQPQLVSGFASVLKVQDGELKQTVMDLSSDYADRCSKAIRTVSLAADGTVTIADELEGLVPETQVLWGANTFTTVDGISGNAVTLSQDAARLTVLNETGQGEWRVVDASQPQPFFRGDSPNPGLKRLEFITRAPADGKLAIRVVIH